MSATETDAELIARYLNGWVPASGQAATLQGELVRALHRLRGEAVRNGNVNWAGRRRGYPRLHRWLRRRLRAELPRDATLDAALRATRSGRHPVTEEEPWTVLGHAVADWLRAHPDPLPHRLDPRLEV